MPSRHLSRILPAALVLLLASAIVHSQTGFDSEVQILERLAEERYAEGDLRKAAELYREIAGKQTEVSDQARALFTAGWLLQLSGDTTGALEAVRESLVRTPGLPFDASLYNRDFELLYRQALDLALQERRRRSSEKTRAAVVAMNDQRDAEARALLESATDLDPDNPSALYNLALLDLEAGADDSAMSDFERVVSLTYQGTGLDSSRLRAKALASLGILYQRQDRPGDAEQSFLEATRADPKEAAAWRSLGLLQYNDRRYDAAATALQRAHELRPEDRELLRLLAECLVLSGNAGQAATTLEAALLIDPADARSWFELGRIEQSRGRSAAAIRALERCLEIDEINATGYAVRSSVLLATIHLEGGNSESALVAANQAVGWNRHDADAWGVLGRVQLEADQPAAATASLGRAAELESDSLSRQLAYGDALAASNQLSQAESVFLRALTLDPGSAPASSRLQEVRGKMADQRAIASGKRRAPRPISPKKIGLEFAGIDYKDLQLRGALVKQVNKKSPAARAGLRKGDLILWIGDYSVLSGKDFFQFLKRSPPGDRLELEYLRDGRIHDVELQLR